MRKTTGFAAFIGLALVLLSMISRFFEILPLRSRNIVMVIGFALMLLGTIWRVVHDMNQPDKE